MAAMEDDLPPNPQKADHSPPQVSLRDLKAYYLNQVDEEKREVIEAQLKDSSSRISGFLRWLRSGDSPPPPDFPRLADLPQEEIEAAEAIRRFALRPPDKQEGPLRLIGPRNPDVPGVNRDGGGKGPA
jgi:hypothetical protein